jgi:hypothetical protein
MRDILRWLDQNKTWVFSGIGVAIPIAIISWWLTRLLGFAATYPNWRLSL